MLIEGNDPRTQPSFRLSNRLMRVLWQVVWCLAFRPSPRPLHRWRAFLLRCFGASIGRDVHVYPSVRIWAPWLLTCEDRVGIGDRAIIYNMGAIFIGREAVISKGAHLCAGTHDIDSPTFQLQTGTIRIGASAWICAEAFIGANVDIPEYCVIGARACVMKSIFEASTVWAGVPAKKIRIRKLRMQSRA